MTSNASKSNLRRRLREKLPDMVRAAARMARNPGRLWHGRGDLGTLAGFVLSESRLSLSKRLHFLERAFTTSYFVDCPHSQGEILAFVRRILALSESVEGCIVEAGCYEGGSTAKFSLVARWAGRELVVFDSFQGLPANHEEHALTIYGKQPNFGAGRYLASQRQVEATVRRFGALENCRFVPGWFEETMRGFDRAVAAVYLDVDLVESTRACLRYLYPLLQPGGYLFSHDGHLPLVIDVLEDHEFWINEVGYPPPPFEGLRRRKLVFTQKPLAQPAKDVPHASSTMSRQSLLR